MCAQSCKSVERGKQGQRVFKIGASGEAKSLFKSSAGSDHSVNNLIKKRGKGLFACRLPHASLLSRQWRPIDRPTGRIYHYHHFHQRRSSLSNRLDFNRLFANLSGSTYLIVRAIIQVFLPSTSLVKSTMEFSRGGLRSPTGWTLIDYLLIFQVPNT